MTFRHNLTNWDEIRSGLDLLCDSVAVRLRQAQRKGARIQVTIRDPQFQTITRQGPLPLPTNLARELTAGAVALVQKHWIVGKPIRMLTVTALNLVPEWDAVEQLDLVPAQPFRSTGEVGASGTRGRPHSIQVWLGRHPAGLGGSPVRAIWTFGRGIGRIGTRKRGMTS